MNKEMQERVLRLDPSEIVIWGNGQEEILNLSNYDSKFNGRYAVNNSTICIVDFDGTVYAAPYSMSLARLLNSNGFAETYFYVPFSNGDKPKNKEVRWRELRAMADDERRKNFKAECEAYCDKNGIGKIPTAILENCFKMPRTGVEVKSHQGYRNTYFPMIHNECLDCIGVEYIGKYCYNNGRIVFVYRDGNTYIAKSGCALAEILRSNGYRESRFFVPLSNSEQIVDSAIAAKWENLPKITEA